MVQQASYTRGKLVYKGRVLRAAKGTPVKLRASADCAKVGKAKVITTVKTGSKGRFEIKMKLPKRLASKPAVFLRPQSTSTSNGPLGKYATYGLVRSVQPKQK
jgi:hypothetical protein